MMTNLTPDEQGLRDYMERSLSDVHGDTQRIEARAVARGRRLRLRRRVGSGLAGAAVIGAVAAVVVPATIDGSGPDGSNRVITDPGPADPGPVTLPSAAGWWDIPAQEVHDRLLPLLPGSVTVDDYLLAPTDRAPGETGQLQGWLRATLSTSSGMTGGLEIQIYAPDVDPAALDPDLATATGVPTASASNGAPVVDGEPSAEQRISCPANLGPARTCTEFDNAAGDHVGKLSTWTQNGLLIEEAAMVRDGGAVFYAATANSTDDKWGWGSTVSSERPPLTLAELRTIAESDTWTDWTPTD